LKLGCQFWFDALQNLGQAISHMPSIFTSLLLPPVNAHQLVSWLLPALL
jgi:hypothetical protein